MFASARWEFFERNYLEMAALVAFCVSCLVAVAYSLLNDSTASPVWSSLISGLLGSVVGAGLVIWAQRTERKAVEERRTKIFVRMLRAETTRLMLTTLFPLKSYHLGLPIRMSFDSPMLDELSRQPEAVPLHLTEIALRFDSMVRECETAVEQVNDSKNLELMAIVRTNVERAIRCWALLDSELTRAFGIAEVYLPLPTSEEAIRHLQRVAKE